MKPKKFIKILLSQEMQKKKHMDVCKKKLLTITRQILQEAFVI